MTIGQQELNAVVCLAIDGSPEVEMGVATTSKMTRECHVSSLMT